MYEYLKELHGKYVICHQVLLTSSWIPGGNAAKNSALTSLEPIFWAVAAWSLALCCILWSLNCSATTSCLIFSGSAAKNEGSTPSGKLFSEQKIRMLLYSTHHQNCIHIYLCALGIVIFIQVVPFERTKLNFTGGFFFSGYYLHSVNLIFCGQLMLFE